MKQLCVSASTGEVNYVWKSRYQSPYMVHKNKIVTRKNKFEIALLRAKFKYSKNDQNKSGELLLFFVFLLLLVDKRFGDKVLVSLLSWLICFSGIFSFLVLFFLLRNIARGTKFLCLWYSFLTDFSLKTC